MEESLFDEAGARAEKPGIARSELSVRAIEDFVRQRENDEITKRLNASYADQDEERG